MCHDRQREPKEERKWSERACVEIDSMKCLFFCLVACVGTQSLPPKFVGKRVLEHLVMCGAFDDLHGNRKAVTETIPDILEWRKKMDAKRKRRLSKGETEEEVMNDDTYDVEEDPNVVKIRESWEESSLTGRKFTPGELYKMEKELIGFYASGDLFKDVCSKQQDSAT